MSCIIELKPTCLVELRLPKRLICNRITAMISFFVFPPVNDRNDGRGRLGSCRDASGAFGAKNAAIKIVQVWKKEICHHGIRLEVSKKWLIYEESH